MSKLTDGRHSRRSQLPMFERRKEEILARGCAFNIHAVLYDNEFLRGIE